MKQFKSKLASISLFGEKDYRIVTQSITASSFKMKEAQTLIPYEIEMLSYLEKIGYDWEYTHG